MPTVKIGCTDLGSSGLRAASITVTLRDARIKQIRMHRLERSVLPPHWLQRAPGIAA
jgi:hypothetical protein